MNDKKTTISQLREKVAAFRDERNWRQFHTPKDLAAAISIEASELAELFLWKEKQQVEKELENPKFRKKVEDEMADVQILLLCLSDIINTDMSQALARKMIDNANKYPVEKAYGSAAKYHELRDNYNHD